MSPVSPTSRRSPGRAFSHPRQAGLLGLGGFAAIRDPQASRATWPQKLWALAWAWALFGGFVIIVVWVAVAFLWFVVRLVLLALAVVLTVVLVVGRGIGGLRGV